jgi:hypothetical protein
MKTDIGHGVSVELRYVEGELDSVMYWHEPCGEDCVPVKPCWKHGWDVLSLEPLTLSPSLLCKVCGKHGFIQEGKWIPA